VTKCKWLPTGREGKDPRTKPGKNVLKGALTFHGRVDKQTARARKRNVKRLIPQFREERGRRTLNTGLNRKQLRWSKETKGNDNSGGAARGEKSREFRRSNETVPQIRGGGKGSQGQGHDYLVGPSSLTPNPSAVATDFPQPPSDGWKTAQLRFRFRPFLRVGKKTWVGKGGQSPLRDNGRRKGTGWKRNRWRDARAAGKSCRRSKKGQRSGIGFKVLRQMMRKRPKPGHSFPLLVGATRTCP